MEWGVRSRLAREAKVVCIGFDGGDGGWGGGLSMPRVEDDGEGGEGRAVG